MTREKFEMEEYPDGCDFLARTVHESDDWMPPIGFVIHRKERVRVKAATRPANSEATS